MDVFSTHKLLCTIWRQVKRKTIPCKASACCLHCGKSHLIYLVSPEVSNANTVLGYRARSSWAWVEKKKIIFRSSVWCPNNKSRKMLALGILVSRIASFSLMFITISWDLLIASQKYMPNNSGSSKGIWPPELIHKAHNILEEDLISSIFSRVFCQKKKNKFVNIEWPGQKWQETRAQDKVHLRINSFSTWVYLHYIFHHTKKIMGEGKNSLDMKWAVSIQLKFLDSVFSMFSNRFKLVLLW